MLSFVTTFIRSSSWWGRAAWATKLVVIGALFIACTVISISFGQEPELGKWRWAEDTMSPTDDKQVHAIGSFSLYYLFTSKGMTKGDAVNTVIWLGLFKEYIDAMVPWEQYGSYGGDGFSIRLTFI